MRLYRFIRKMLGNSLKKTEKLLYARKILPPSKLFLPNFLGIGAMKSGTTWLYENLRCHSEIYLPEQKELYYFNIRFNSTWLKSYSALFEPGCNIVKGDITPGYSIIPPGRIRFIRAIMPDVKLIFLMRNPVHRTWSEACMNLVEKPKKKFEEVKDEEFLSYFKSEPCRKRSDYMAIINSWLEVFPSEQLFTAFLDEIEESPRDLLVRIFRFIEVSTRVNWEIFPADKIVLPHYENNKMVYHGNITEHYSPSETFLPKRFLETLKAMHEDQIKELHRRYGAPINRWLLQ